MKKKSYLLAFSTYILTLFLCFTISSNQTHATTESSSDTGGSFGFEVIQPDNQQSEVGYYDLHMNPSQEQTVQIRMTNNTDQEKKISLDLTGAKTNGGGVIEYAPFEIENDDSLKFPFEEIVTGPKEIVLAPHSEQMVDIHIKMPETSFEGYIAGGIQIIDVTQDMQTTGMVKNKMAYMVGMLLSVQSLEEIEQIPEDMKLNSVKAGLSNYSNAVYVDFSNVQPIYVDGLTVDVQIMQKGKDEVIYDKKKSQMSMAPNSKIKFPVEMNGEQMIPGDYRAKILVTTEKGGRWEWDQNFTITDKEADEFNSQDLNLVQDPGLNWQLIALIVGGILVVLLIIFLVIRVVHKKKEKKKRKNKVKTKSVKKRG